ncbi:MAG TPA: helix-hairpin-helix domain-containing protein, partial [Acidimicrobiales bacterium]|nr:helix-hairpin-helix domain-containing protein [Acidimicrobiales bacterium]
LAELSTEEILDLRSVASVLHLPGDPADLDTGLQPRGYRLLARVPRLPDSIVEHIVERFGSLHKILRASVADLDEVEGIGETRAKAIEEALKRLAETSILDRYG